MTKPTPPAVGPYDLIDNRKRVIGVGCNCSIPRIEDCKEQGFPRGCYHVAKAWKPLLGRKLREAAIAATIERCAQVAEDWGLGRVNQTVKDYPATSAAAIAFAIRALKEKP
jgi:hypothetical protein